MTDHPYVELVYGVIALLCVLLVMGKLSGGYLSFFLSFFPLTLAPNAFEVLARSRRGEREIIPERDCDLRPITKFRLDCLNDNRATGSWPVGAWADAKGRASKESRPFSL
jgi:hypothetical protein